MCLWVYFSQDKAYFEKITICKMRGGNGKGEGELQIGKGGKELTAVG